MRTRSWQLMRGVMLAFLIAFSAIAICYLCMLAFGSLLAEEIFPGLQSMYHSDSMEPLKLRLGRNKVLLRIPRAYIFGLDAGKHGTYDTIQFTAFLPDMATEQFYDWDHPLLAAGDHDAILNQGRDWLAIELSGNYWSNVADARKKFAEEIVQFRVGWDKVPVRQLPDYDVYIDDYPNDMKPGYDYRKAMDAMFVPKTEKSYYIDCTGQTIYEDGECTVLYNYKDEFRVGISFEQEDLPQAVSIKNLVNAFLDAATAPR